MKHECCEDAKKFIKFNVLKGWHVTLNHGVCVTQYTIDCCPWCGKNLEEENQNWIDKNIRVEDLDLSVYTSACLVKNGIKNLFDLKNTNIMFLKAANGLGPKKMKELRNFLKLNDIKIHREHKIYRRKI